MKLADNIKNLFENSKITVGSDVDKKIFNKAINALPHQAGQPDRQIWSIIMHSKITKLSTAAAIIIAVIIGISLFNGEPAWALEQSIEAMKNYRGFSCYGTITIPWTEFFKQLGVHLPDLPEPAGDYEMWAQFDEHLSRTSKLKVFYPNNFSLSGSKLHSYIQLPDGTTYDIAGDYMKLDPLADPEGMRQLKDLTDTWFELQGIDAETGRKRILVKCGISEANRSWQFEFDAESKLLVNFKQWNSSSCQQGTPTLEDDRFVYYDRLPEDIFEINLPESDKIISVNTPMANPDCGISTEGLTRKEACYKIIEQIWQAVKEQDYETIRKLAPLTALMSDEQIKSMFSGDPESYILLEMEEIYESALGPTVPCIFEIAGEKMIIDIVVMFRENNGSPSCVIYGTIGQLRPVE